MMADGMERINIFFFLFGSPFLPLPFPQIATLLVVILSFLSIGSELIAFSWVLWIDFNVSSLLYKPVVKLAWKHGLFTVCQSPDSIVSAGYTIVCPVRSHFLPAHHACPHVRACAHRYPHTSMRVQKNTPEEYVSKCNLYSKTGLSAIVSSFCSFLFSLFRQYAPVAHVIKKYFKKPFSSFPCHTSVRSDTHPLMVFMVIYLNDLFEMALIFGKCWDNWVTHHILGEKVNKKPQRNRWRFARQRSGSSQKVFGSRYMYAHELSWNFPALRRGWI